MNLTESYPLIYDGNGEHQILGLAKTDLLGKAISATDNKRLANYFLEVMGFDKENAALAKAWGMQNHDLRAVRQVDYITHIHQNKSAEIRSKWPEPPMTDEEASEILFADKLEKELEKLAIPIEAEIRL